MGAPWQPLQGEPAAVRRQYLCCRVILLQIPLWSAGLIWGFRLSAAQGSLCSFWEWHWCTFLLFALGWCVLVALFTYGSCYLVLLHSVNLFPIATEDWSLSFWCPTLLTSSCFRHCFWEQPQVICPSPDWFSTTVLFDYSFKLSSNDLTPR